VTWSKALNHQTVVIGASLGGLVTNLLGCTKATLDVLISVIYASNTAHLVWNSDIAKYIKKDFHEAGSIYSNLEEVWNIINPTKYTPQVSKENILLISGKYDEFITKEDSEELWDSWGKPERIVIPCGHSGLNVYHKSISTVIRSFIHKVL